MYMAPEAESQTLTLIYQKQSLRLCPDMTSKPLIRADLDALKGISLNISDFCHSHLLPHTAAKRNQPLKAASEIGS